MSDSVALQQLALGTIRLIHSADDDSFAEHALRLFAFQFAHNAPYAAWCEKAGVTPDQTGDWNDIPALPISAFKQADVSVLGQADRTAWFQSSGTSSGARSRHHFNPSTLAVYEASLNTGYAAAIGNARSFPALVSLTPPPREASHSSLVHMIETLGRRSGAHAYFGRSEEGSSWTVDAEGLGRRLAELVAEGQPILLIGTAFGFVQFIDAADGVRWALPEGSMIVETGGYKNQSRVLSREDLHAALAGTFGLRSADVRTEYGMSELCSQAYDSAKAPGQFAWPPWVRCRVVSPETGLEVPDGEPGCIEILDLANVGSCLRILTEDIGMMASGRMSLLGRATSAVEKGCSLFQSTG